MQWYIRVANSFLLCSVVAYTFINYPPSLSHHLLFQTYDPLIFSLTTTSITRIFKLASENSTLNQVLEKSYRIT